jgi:hypothetical protein
MTEECFEIVPGSYEPFPLEFFDEDSKPLIITGATIHLLVKNDFYDDDEDAVIHKEVTEHDDAEHGKSTVVLDEADTLKILRNKFYCFIIKLVDADDHSHFPAILKIKAGV